MSEEEKKVSQKTIDEYVTTISYQDYLIAKGTAPSTVKVRSIEAYRSAGDDRLSVVKLSELCKREIYDYAVDIDAEAVVALKPSVYYNVEDDKNAVYMIGTAIIPVQTEDK